MKLQSIQLKNYRCFDELKMTLDPKLTVIVAENGQGKSTILDAIRVGLWPFISAFDLAKPAFNDPANGIPLDDIRVIRMSDGSMARQLEAEIVLSTENETWKRYKDSEETKAKTLDDENVRALRAVARIQQKKIRNPEVEDVDLMTFGYYGTGRLWAQKKLTESKKGEKDDTLETSFYVRTFAYRNCMDPASSYKHFREWFIWAWEARKELREKSNISPRELEFAESRIAAVQQVIDTFLKETTGWHTLEYSISNQKSLILNHDVYGINKVDQLSDGIRSMLAMVGDIAYRCVKLNPHMKENAPKKTQGVVLIDEVDMHLHPRWQQLVLTQLQKAFHNIQFVVTTHSPQVLTTVKPKFIRGLKYLDGKVCVREDYQFSEGAEAQFALQDILGVETRPAELRIVKKLKQYLEHISRDTWDTKEALDIRKELDVWSSGYEPALIKADMDIRMRQFRNKK